MKNELRRKLFDVRASIKNREEKEAIISNKLQKYIFEKNFSTILSYVSMGTEVETKKIIDDLMKIPSLTLLIPFTVGSKMIAVIYEGEALNVNKIGNVIDIEDKLEFTKKIDISITPLLGFNGDNHRIGYGKGCYDQYYVRHNIKNKVGIAFDEQEINFERDKYDIPLDIIFTPTRIIRLGVKK
ncbi:MAG: 5-formyltetrahydrofolate cyclo-ligase [Firmicutes bacterium]|nr:5-formyltetrahydrofolate cyclo-ligase [Bacillota bacterium]MCL2256047.1 5-formyltetrahydrofolate cyclo-ligase [Bacillota bacterium]